MKQDFQNFHSFELGAGPTGKGRDIFFISKRIGELKNYFKENKNDQGVARVIIQLVQRRKKLLSWLSLKDPVFFKKITDMLLNAKL